MSGLTAVFEQTAPIPLAAELACAPGELLALVGPSGSGKSTILRAIAGTYRPSGGRVAVNSEIWFDSSAHVYVPAHRRSVGMVFQNYALFPHLSALDNVMTAMQHLPPSERSARARELLRLVHLEGLEARRPAQISGGQQQRVAVARALAREPKVLLLDEPFSAVDKSTRQRLYREIAELRTALSMPVVLVTHDLDEALMLADRLTVLHHGRTLQSGAPVEVTEKPVSAEVARLVDVRNLFDARVLAHEPEHKRSLIEAGGQRLEAALQARFPVGSRVTCAVPDSYVVAHRKDRPSRGERENPIHGVLEAVLTIGALAHLRLRPSGSFAQPLHLSLPAHVARRNGFVKGATATVSLLATGIHFMPHQAAPSDRD